jgi:lipid II:glycine glycyltransferase (peptidoglycan interpeptide bridge formation enzyme)
MQSVTEKERKMFNSVVNHPLQSFEWGEFRQGTGVKVIRRGLLEGAKLKSGFQLTIHPIPHTPFTIGYLPKGEMPSEALLEELKKIGKEERCVFIQLEPNVIASQSSKFKVQSSKSGLRPAARPLFTKYTFILDLKRSEEELLANMHQKARYNIKVAKKRNVTVVEDNTQKAFNEYLNLTEETTRRQKFFAHTLDYHKKMWEALRVQSSKLKVQSVDKDQLTAHLLTAKYKGKVLTAWILFVFKDTLYYPYGASSSQNREVMASNLVMWEAIRFGKKLGLAKFDMWGALGPDPDRSDPWFGFHNFKEKYGPEHVEFIGSFDLVINPLVYQLYKIADKLRWFLLKFKK